jgi:ABC-2 type transport system permease protein
LNILKVRPDEREFDKRYLPVAVLVEGEFKSLYEGRITHQMDTSSLIKFMSEGKEAKQIFIADGDIIKNQIDRRGPLPLGYDKYTQLDFGNKEFLMNCINYLVGDDDLIQVRSREIKLRLLDKTKMLKKKTTWQVYNILMPLMVVILMGGILVYYRRRKYTK